jgi:hypothetical protein
MITLEVIALGEFLHGTAKKAFTLGYELGQALRFNSENEPFGVGIQVGTSWRQSN